MRRKERRSEAGEITWEGEKEGTKKPRVTRGEMSKMEEQGGHHVRGWSDEETKGEGQGERTREREKERETERGQPRHKHSVAWHGISIDIYTVSMGISTRSDSGRAPPNTADSDPARSTQTRESIVAFKLPSYSGGLSLPESRATSGQIRMYGTYVSRRRALRSVLTLHPRSVFVFHEKKKRREGNKEGRELYRPTEARGPGRAERSGG